MCFTGALMLFRNEISAFFGYASGDMPFFKTVMKLHRWLMLVPENPHGGMSAGRFVMGLSAIAATLILISGIVLWWPRDGKRLKSNLSISFSHGWRRFMRDSHVALGAYACIFLLLMSLTGPVWSFGWYRSAAVAVIGGHEGERPGRKGEADIRAHTTDRSGRPEEAGKRHGASAGMQAGGRGQKPAQRQVGGRGDNSHLLPCWRHRRLAAHQRVLSMVEKSFGFKEGIAPFLTRLATRGSPPPQLSENLCSWIFNDYWLKNHPLWCGFNNSGSIVYFFVPLYK